MSDDEAKRPRPEYGEYATPEEQRARMGLPPAHHASGWPHGAAGPAPSAPSAPSESPVTAHRPPTEHADAPAGAERPTRAGMSRHRPPRPWDRMLTWLLLALGLLSLAASAGSYLNMAPAMQAAYDELGIGHFGAAAIAGPAGIALVIVQSVVWVASVLFARRSMHRGRISFWIPLVGAVVSYIALVAVLLIVVLNDPAFVAYVSASGHTAP